jgi:sugar (pentulose or hexulose) kinase
MTYYGSYFGAAEVGGDLRRDMCDTQLDHFPYHWRVSLPCFGIYLEQVLAEVTSKSRDEAFDRFEQELVARPAGPIETSMTVSFNRYEYDDGSGEFVGAIGGLDDCHSFGEMAVGLASQFGLALRRAAQDGTLSNVRTWAAAGGGSRNLALVEITSQISGLVQTARSGSWTCKGTAMLAQSLS